MHQQVVRNAVCRLQPTSFRERQHPCILEKTPTPMHTCVRGACAIPLPRSNGAHMDSRQVASFKTSCCVLIWVSNDMGIECLSTRSLPYRLAAFTRHTKSCARKRPMHCKQDTKLTKPPHKTYQVSGEETTQTLNRNMGGASCLLLPVGCRWDDQELQSATLVLLPPLPLELLHLLHLSHNMSCYTILFHLFPLAPDQQDCVYLTAMAAVECGGFMWWILVYLPRSSWV